MAYIERESAIKSLLNDAPEQVGYSREDAADCIRYMDAADVAPVRHGRWVPTEAPFMNECEDCSVCGYRTVWGHRYNYCPNCGCKMDLEEAKNAKQS